MRIVAHKELWILGFVACILLHSGQQVYAQKALDLEQALGVMEALEKRIERVQWEVIRRSGKLRNPADITSFVPAEIGDRGWAVLEPHTGRYRVELDSVGRWQNAIEPFIAAKGSFAFDAEISREFERTKGGTQFPGKDDHPGNGALRKGDHSEVLKLGENCGIRYFPPFYGRGLSSHQILSEFLRENRKKGEPVEITEDAAGQWQIRTTEFKLPLTLTYDPGKGGVILAGSRANPEGQVWERIVFELQEVDGPFWVPRTVSIVNTIDNLISQINYREVRVNQPVADDLFRFDFPSGARVTDHIEKRVYWVGAPITDEQEAIREYIISQGLSPKSGPNWLQITLIAVAATIVAFLLWKGGRRWLGTKAAALSVAILFLPPYSPCWAQTKPQNESKDRAVSKMAQCGYRVTVFALEYFGIEDYQAKEVFAALEPTKDGIRLSAIQETLRSHGLSAEAREGVSEAELRKALQGGRLAIVPFDLGENHGHYFVALNHSQKGPVLVDVLGRVRPLAEGLTDKRGKWPKGLVLLLEKARTTNGVPVSREANREMSISFEPREINFGRLGVPPSEVGALLKKEFTIRNSGKNPVTVTEIAVSCACMTGLSWKGAELLPGDSQKITFSIIPGAWGMGHQDRTISFELASGRFAEFHVKGEVVLPKTATPLTVSPQVMRLDMTDNKAKEIVREALVSFDSDKSQVPRVATKASWLVPHIKFLEKNTAQLQLKIAGERIPFSGSLEQEAEVEVLASEGDSKATVKVVAFRRKFFKTTPDFVILSAKEGKKQTITITPVKERTDRITATRVWAQRDNLEITLEQRGEAVALVVGG